MQATLLVELLTEELPPKSLKELGQAFGSALFFDLQKSGFLSDGSTVAVFGTPRRLAAQISKVRERSPDTEREVQGPSVGAPAQAIGGFAKKIGVAVDALEKRSTPKGEVFFARAKSSGEPLDAVLARAVEAALKALPIPKLMRWGEGAAQFVRPVHGLVMLHGSRVVPGKVLEIGSGNTTLGHRFLGDGPVGIGSADAYETTLEAKGRVIADFARRRERIRAELEKQAAGAQMLCDDALLDEVTALVEWPAVYAGTFDARFLEVPQECLALSMQQHQRYFPLADAGGKLLPRFLIVSNMQVTDPANIVRGNERVLRARLADAKFFYDRDRKERLEARVPRLAQVVYHNKLGSQLERIERIQLLAGQIARDIGADPALAERAAWLAKADLLTGMVGEFPELQGVMGRYYALHDGEPKEVADAIEAHYRPRFAGDEPPAHKIAVTLALADKLESLAGLFGIGQQPTGDKDPFALRRHALGVVRILIEGALPVSLHDLVNAAFAVFPRGALGDAHTDLEIFVFERLRGYLREAGYSANEIESVLCMNPVRLDQVPRQLAAVRAFMGLSEAPSLSAANKRVANILKQAAAKGESFRNADRKSLKEPAEIALLDAINTAAGKANPLFDRGDYTGYLRTFAVDDFFDSVMVMVDEPSLRRNRLALLADLREAMNRIADISRLAVEK